MSSQLPTPDPLNPVNIDCSVSDQPANVTLQKSVLSFPPFFAGKVVKYQLKIQNTGGQNIKNLVLLESVSPITITEDQLGITEEPICLNAGFTSFVEYEYTLTEEDVVGPFTNIATISSTTNEIEPVTASQTLDVSIPSQLSIQKSVTPSGPYNIGDTLNFTVLISSFGGDTDIDFVRLTDTLVTEKTGSDQLTITQDTANLLQGNLTSLTPDQYLEIQYSYTVQPEDYPGGFSNTATVTYDDDNKQKTASLNISEILQPGEIAISKTAAPGPYESGVNDVITFTVSVSNIGEGPVNVPQLVDSIGLPGQDFTLISDVSGLFAAGNTQILGGDVAEATYEYTIPLENFASGTITNEVVAGGKSASVTINGLIGNPYIFNIDTTYIELRDASSTTTSANSNIWRPTSTNKDMFLLPLLPPEGAYSISTVKYGTGNYDMLVDWGDGTTSRIKNWDDIDCLHIYNAPGTYQIKIYGVIEGWSFTNIDENIGGGTYYGTTRLIQWLEDEQVFYEKYQVNSLKQLTNYGVEEADRINWIETIPGSTDITKTDKRSYIYKVNGYLNNDTDGFKGLTIPPPILPTSDPNFNTNRHRLFDVEDTAAIRLSDRVKYLDTISWGRLVITGGKTDEGEQSSRVFAGCQNYTGSYSNTVDIGQPEFQSGVDNLAKFFSGCIKFNGDITNWDVSNIKNFVAMFYECHKFNKNLNNWDVSNATTLQSMFNNCRVFNQPLNNWGDKLTNITGSGLRRMFVSCFAFNQDIDSWGNSLTNNITTLEETFYRCFEFNSSLNSWGNAIENVVSLRETFYMCGKFNKPLDLWLTNNVVDLFYGFFDCRSFDQDINAWNVQDLRDLGGTFLNCVKYRGDLDLWGPNLQNLVNLKSTFANCQSLTGSLETWGPYVSGVTSMDRTFINCRIYNQPMNTWDVRKVNTLYFCFKGCQKFNQNLDNWRLESMNNTNALYATFADCFDLGKDDIPRFDTWSPYITGGVRFDSTFAGCDLSGPNIGIGQWNVSRMRSAQQMFLRTKLNDPDMNLWGPKLTAISDSGRHPGGGGYPNGFMSMFKGSTFNHSLSDWSTAMGRLSSAEGMFTEGAAFDQDISMWDFTNVTGPDVGSPSLTNFINAGFSTENYEKLLEALYNNINNLQDNVYLSFVPYRTNASDTWFNALTSQKNWTIVPTGEELDGFGNLKYPDWPYGP